MLLDPENQDDNVWADSAYSEQGFEDLLSLGSFEGRIHEKGSRNHPQIGLERNESWWALKILIFNFLR